MLMLMWRRLEGKLFQTVGVAERTLQLPIELQNVTYTIHRTVTCNRNIDISQTVHQYLHHLYMVRSFE